VGYTFDRLMVYGTGGIAATNVEMTSTYTAVTMLGAALLPIAGLPNPAGTTSISDNHTFVGVTFGAGFEHAVTDAITVGAEYRYTYYGENTFTTGVTPAGFIPSTPPSPVSLNLNMHQITARVNYLFGRP
jgi:outer membrane immunogenic protein